ncbi:MAG: tetratricopeptide repeat protein [Chitinophagaceae bacterium]
MRTILFCLFFSGPFLMYGQKADTLIKAAILQMESGKYDQALELLSQAEKSDPSNMAPVYEMGMAYYLRLDYLKALPYFQKAVNGNYRNTSPEAFAMLGNTLDLKGDSAGAIKVYQDGRRRFPKSGRLWVEEGHLFTQRNHYEQALCRYEQAIKTEPSLASAYRGAATIWALTEERFNVLMLGETFMNLELAGQRNENMSEMLYMTIQSAIKFTDSSAEVVLTKNMVATMEKGKLVLPFAASYEAGFMVGFTPILINRTQAKSKSKLSLKEIYTLYRAANLQWFERKNNKRYPNAILDQQTALAEKDLLEAYVYWLFRKGQPEEYQQWLQKNGSTFKQFEEWMQKHKLELNNRNTYTTGFICKDQKN